MKQILSAIRSKLFNRLETSREETYIKRKFICVQSSVDSDQKLSFNEQANYIHKQVCLKYGSNEKTVEPDAARRYV